MLTKKKKQSRTPEIYSFNRNIENPFSILYEECLEPPDTKKIYKGSNVCGITDINGLSTPWGRGTLFSDPDFTCIGCSCTVSMGLIEEYSWPSIIRSFTRTKVNNLSSPGAGIEFLSALAIDSFAEFGRPKHVLAIFPDIYRMWTINSASESDEQNHTIHLSWDTNVHEYFLDVRHSVLSGRDRPELLKPFVFEDKNKTKTTASPDLAVFNNFTLLEMLINYCKINDITFKFVSWDDGTNVLFSNMEYYKDNYVPAVLSKDSSKLVESDDLLKSSTEMDAEWWDSEIGISETYRVPWRRIGMRECCDHFPQTEYQKKWWSVASDNGKHPGIHDQIHFAEHLLNQRIENEFLRTLP